MTSLGGVRFGKVVYRVLAGISDGPDANKTPDGIPVTGTGTLTPRVERVIDQNGVFPATTVLPQPVKVSFVNGYLTYRGDPHVWLIASQLGVWRWQASFTYKIGSTEIRDEFFFDLPPGDPDSVTYKGTDLSVSRQVVDPGTGNITIVGPPGRSVADIVLQPHGLLFVMSNGADIDVEIPYLGELSMAATDANASKLAAAASASAAAASAATASEAKDDVAASASAAAASALDAANSKDDVEASAAAAVTAASAAAASATAAGTSASTATTAKDAAVAANSSVQGLHDSVYNDALPQMETHVGDTVAAKNAAQAAQAAAEAARDSAAAGVVPDNGVSTIKVQDGAVTVPKLAAGVQASLAKADASVPSTSSAFVVYTTDAAGVNSAAVAYSSAATANTVAFRTAGGVMSVGTPTAGTHATTKDYVDGLVGPKAADADVVKLAGAQTITGAKTFSGQMTVPNAIASSSPVTKSQMDTGLGGKVSTGSIPFDVGFVHTGDGARKVGLGGNRAGVRIPRAVTFSSLVVRFDTADASGTTSVRILKSGSPVSGASVSITATGVEGSASGSWSFAAGDILQVEITTVGGTPGKGCVANLVGLC